MSFNRDSFCSFTFQSGDIQIELNGSKRETTFKFTFQSGDIQIKTNDLSPLAYLIPFTFQSGDIQMAISSLPLPYRSKHLHSNLVIFK